MALRFAVPSTSEEALPEPSVSRGRVLIPSGVPTRVVKPAVLLRSSLDLVDPKGLWSVKTRDLSPWVLSAPVPLRAVT